MRVPPCRRSELFGYDCLVDDGPDLLDLALSKLVEHVFIETDTPAVYGQPEEVSNRCAVECKPSGDHRWVTDNGCNVERKIWDSTKVRNEHVLVALETDFGAVVSHLVGDKVMEVLPALSVQARNVSLIRSYYLFIRHVCTSALNFREV